MPVMLVHLYPTGCAMRLQQADYVVRTSYLDDIACSLENVVEIPLRCRSHGYNEEWSRATSLEVYISLRTPWECSLQVTVKVILRHQFFQGHIDQWSKALLFLSLHDGSLSPSHDWTSLHYLPPFLSLFNRLKPCVTRFLSFLWQAPFLPCILSKQRSVL